MLLISIELFVMLSILLFIDPSYEQVSEYRLVASILQKAYRRFATGVYCIWYPLIDRKIHQSLLRPLASLTNNQLHIEFYFTPMTHKHMYGCGLLILNPPYLLHEQMTQSLQVLTNFLNPSISTYKIVAQ